MAKFAGFIGPAYEARASAADYERSINLYPEQNGPNATDPWTLYPTAGLAAFATLPSSPVRGLWVGEHRLFAVAGATYYEVASNGSYTARGTVANDGLPAQIFPNGNQVMVISGGLVYIDTGTDFVQPTYTSAQGSVNVAADGAVSLVFGDVFDTSMVGSAILIASVAYTVTVFTDSTHITVDPAPPVASAVAFSVPQSGRVVVSGTAVGRVSGDPFVYAMAGHSIQIGTGTYTVASVIDANNLLVTTPPSDQSPPTFWYVAQLPVTASCGAFLDGYFIVATPNTKQVNISALNNGLRWNPLDYANKEAYPDNVVQMIADHRELILFGSQTCEVWRNTGNADFPLEPDPGMFVQLNCGAPASAAKLPEGPIWLEGEARGGPVCYYAQGFSPKRVSTHALEYRWKKFSSWTDAEGFVFEDDGHWFYQVSFPTAGETWVYDATAGCWHQRAGGNTSLTRHRARCHAYVWGKHIVGDYSTGQLYYQSTEYADDAGTPILRVRRAPHLTNDLTRTFYHDFLLALQFPATVAVTLAWSDDYGTTWSTPRSPDGTRVARGYSGRPLALRWSRLGSAQDRIFEVKATFTTSSAMLAAEINPSPGT